MLASPTNLAICVPTVSFKGLSDFFAPTLERLFDQSHELIGHRAINDAVVISKREMDQGSHGDGIVSILVSDDNWCFGNAANTHDCGIGLINDWQAKHRTELSGISNCEG